MAPTAAERLAALEESLRHMDTLQEQLNALRVEHTQLEQTNNQLAAQVAEQQQAGRNNAPEPKVAPPEYFSGQRNKLKNFITQTTLVVSSQPRRYQTERAKVLYAGSYLRDTAFQWFQPHLISENPPAFMDHFNLFCQELTKLFGDPDEKGTATRQLYALRQRGSAAAYVTDFRRLTAVLGWDNDAMAAQFYRGLKDSVKDELARVGRPELLQDLIDMTIRIDTRLFERTMEKGVNGPLSFNPGRPIQQRPMMSPRYSTPYQPQVDKKPAMPPQPFQLRGTNAATFTRRGKITPDEYQRRVDQSLCLYCASPKHTVKDCPDAPSRLTNRNAPQLRSTYVDFSSDDFDNEESKN